MTTKQKIRLVRIAQVLFVIMFGIGGWIVIMMKYPNPNNVAGGLITVATVIVLGYVLALVFGGHYMEYNDKRELEERALSGQLTPRDLLDEKLARDYVRIRRMSEESLDRLHDMRSFIAQIESKVVKAEMKGRLDGEEYTFIISLLQNMECKSSVAGGGEILGLFRRYEGWIHERLQKLPGYPVEAKADTA